MFIGGIFNDYSGVSANFIIKLNNDLTIDPTFQYGVGFGGGTFTRYWYDVATTPDNEYVFVGSFLSFSGISANRVIKIGSTGQVDNTFLTNIGSGFNNTVNSIRRTSDNKFLIGGSFTSFNGTPVNRVALLNTDGTLDTLFNDGNSLGGANNLVHEVIETNDGNYLVIGQLNSFNGVSNGLGVYKFSYDGTVLW
jgi:hypothetical protein